MNGHPGAGIGNRQGNPVGADPGLGQRGLDDFPKFLDGSHAGFGQGRLDQSLRNILDRKTVNPVGPARVQPRHREKLA